ncbi:hypothetical protein PanWU01x14_044140 [Parasponia andersonii]|uniref:Uncharacterized protein n=1 Tax=Parasponia andersonii TaxID=3476 RepID=A0A2P5DP45_PARAD|nr:hypothetical protein PanWU01x14_044140 [Parasponia andersonii]
MPVFLLKIIFFILSTISYFVSRFIFSTIAYLLVFLIHTLKVPGENAKGLLEQVAEALKGFIQYTFDLAVEAITTIVSMSFDHVKEGVMGSASVASSAVLGLVEQTKASFEGLVKDLPELWEGFSEMVSTIATDLWNNYKDALGYVRENIGS